MSTTGTLPKRHNTVLAEVLASLLAGTTLTHGDALSACSTMRLAHHIHSLKKDYDWHIVTGDRVVGCQDGRTQTIAAYSLPHACIAAIDQAKRETYIRSVRHARAELKSNRKADYDRK
ncbi:MAG: hypothetical protein ABL923_06655 [Burkholderiaceae bacterium]